MGDFSIARNIKLCFITFILHHAGCSDKSISFTSPSAGYHSGNLIVPIGSSKIHCDPPKEYEPQKGKTVATIFIYLAIFILNVYICLVLSFCHKLCRLKPCWTDINIRVQTCMRRVYCHAIFILLLFICLYLLKLIILSFGVFWHKRGYFFRRVYF